MKQFFFDTETTGVDKTKHGIHQLSFIITDNDRIIEKVNMKLVPFAECEYTEEALTITKTTKESIQKYPLTEKQAVDKLMKILDKYVFKFNKKDKYFMVGYNVHFDNQFLRELFIRTGEKYFGSYFWSNPIDVMTLATQKLLEERSSMDNFKLMTVAEKFGLLEGKDEANFHDAMFDIEITKDIYNLLIKPPEPIIINKESISLMTGDNHVEKINTKGYEKPIYALDNDKFIFMFGKHLDKTFEQVYNEDPSYLLWCHNNNIKGIKFSENDLKLIEAAAASNKFKQNKKQYHSVESDGGIHYSAGSQTDISVMGGYDDCPF